MRHGLDACRSVSGTAGPATAPPAGIGGTGKPPAYASTGASASASTSRSLGSPTKNSDQEEHGQHADADQRYCRSIDAARASSARKVATATIQASETGISTFQPNFMNWS